MTGDPAHDQFYEPPMAPYRPVRVRAVPIVVVLIMLVGTLVGGYYLAKAAGWLEPRSPMQSVGTHDGIGIKSRITYPTEPASLTTTNHRDLTQEQLDALKRELVAQRKLLEELASRKPPTTPAPSAPSSQKVDKPKKYLSRVDYVRKEPITDMPGKATRLYAGSYIPVVLLPRQNSDREGCSTVKAREHVRDSTTGEYILIPQGSQITMCYKSKDLMWNEERVEVGLDTLTLPGGREINLPKAAGIDHIGQEGWSGDVDRHYWRLLSAVLIRGVLRGGAQMVNTQIGGAGAGSVAGSIAQEGAQAGQQQTQPFINIKPTIITPEGEPLNIRIHKGVSLPIYQEPTHALR